MYEYTCTVSYFRICNQAQLTIYTYTIQFLLCKDWSPISSCPLQSRLGPEDFCRELLRSSKALSSSMDNTHRCDPCQEIDVFDLVALQVDWNFEIVYVKIRNINICHFVFWILRKKYQWIFMLRDALRPGGGFKSEDFSGIRFWTNHCRCVLKLFGVSWS